MHPTAFFGVNLGLWKYLQDMQKYKWFAWFLKPAKFSFHTGRATNGEPEEPGLYEQSDQLNYDGTSRLLYCSLLIYESG